MKGLNRMARMLRMILLCIFRIPIYFLRLNYHSKHMDEFSEDLRFQMIRRMAAHVCRAGAIDVKVTGLENIPKESGFMLYPNHQGMFDVVAMLKSFPTPFSVVYKKELQNIILLKQAFAVLEAQAIDRSDLRQSMTVINTVAEQVRSGRNYVIFAEGTRNRDKNKVHSFKPGSFKIATKAKCPVVPVAQVDMYRALDDKGARPITVQIHVLPVIPYDEYKGMKTIELAEMVQNRINDKINEIEANRR